MDENEQRKKKPGQPEVILGRHEFYYSWKSFLRERQFVRIKMDVSPEEVHTTLLPCSFKFHEFAADIGDIRITCHIMKMEHCLYLWIGNSTNMTMNDLCISFPPTVYETMPFATKIMGSIEDTISTNIAKRLSKKLGKPVYVSFNLQVDNLSLPLIERRIQEEFTTNKELSTF